MIVYMHIRKGFYAAALFTGCLLLAGCGAYQVAAKPVSLGPESFPMVPDKDAGLVYIEPDLGFQGYEIVVVADPVLIAAKPEGLSVAEMRQRLKTRLIQDLGATGVFPQVMGKNTSSAMASMPERRVLLLEPFITELDPGSQALRYFVGFGAGATRVQVQVRAIDQQTGKVHFMTADRRHASFGMFGGDSRQYLLDSLEGIANGLATFVKRIAAGGEIEPPTEQ